MQPVTAAEVVEKLKATGADGVDIQFAREAVTADFVREVNAAGFSVHVWTVDDISDAVEAFKRGVATVTTNCAKRLLDLYQNPPQDAAGRFWTQDNGNGQKGPHRHRRLPQLRRRCRCVAEAVEVNLTAAASHEPRTTNR